jgi:3-deoxy-D-manno-octulosonic-acid transferase
VRVLYSCLAYLLAPAYLGVLLWRGLRERGYWRGLGERFGLGTTLPRETIWIHAASVGEVQAATALAHALRRASDLTLVITTTTPAGAARARASFAGSDTDVRHVPLDLPGSVGRFFDRARPRIAVILETELWPNLYHECAARCVPLVLANARLSARSVRHYRLIAPLLRRTLACAHLIAAQSDADAARFRALGAEPARIQVIGNLKFDFSVPADIYARGRALRARCAGARAIWVAGSTHEGEEREVLQAHAIVRRAHPDALLILVPRHPQRFEEVASGLARSAIPFARLSRGETCTAETSVLLGDTLGQLLELYAAADVAFVGGSLVPIGGHNLLEPAALERPILTGPHNANGADIARLLVARGAARIVHDAHELGARLTDLLSDREERARMGARARAVVEENCGALARLVARLEPMLVDAVNARAAAAPAESVGLRDG